MFSSSSGLKMNSKDKIDLANIRLDYKGFKELAANKGLSKYEKIGFPNSYRQNYENAIFEDIISKLTNISMEDKTILDIGPGCSDLPLFLIDLCKKQNHKLVFSDSEEMLSFHKDQELLFKVPGMFPKTFKEISKISNKYDVILCYSVFHYIFIDTNIWSFIDSCLELLAPKGQLLIGDIPNISKRKRFFSSESGIRYHKEFTKTNENPDVLYNKIEHEKIDDAVIISILMRAQSFGFDAYLLPQDQKLPMSNRRDDILIVRP